MNYHKEIIERIKNPNTWPKPERENFLDVLKDLADTSFEKTTTEGYLAALLIYHQLTEEFLKIMIECSDFKIQLLVFPSEFPIKKLSKKMFGQIVGELENGILDEDIKLLIAKSRTLNSLRKRMVHEITVKTSIKDIENQCKKVKSKFNEIHRLYLDIYDTYYNTFSDFNKYSEDLEEMLN